MTRPASLLLAISIFLAGCGDLISAPDAPLLGVDSRGIGELEGAVVQLVNGHRERLGCQHLHWDPELASVAFAYSREMHDRQFFGHVDPDGRGVLYRLRQARIRFQQAAENLARGFREGDQAGSVVAAWLNSPDHRQNIENCSYHRTGLGVYSTYWTHLFAF
jgi:uncharacterized protein YkwD